MKSVREPEYGALVGGIAPFVHTMNSLLHLPKHQTGRLHALAGGQPNFWLPMFRGTFALSVGSLYSEDLRTSWSVRQLQPWTTVLTA